MAAPDKNPGNSTSAPPTDARVIQLAQPRFFVQSGYFQNFIFARLPAGEGLAHRVVLDLENNTMYCNCVFRPRPCLHALALQHLYTRFNAAFSAADTIPGWAQALLTGAGGQVLSRPADPAAARQQRHSERLERAADGFDDLEGWLLDTIRRGLATTVAEDSQWSASIAARMADASLTGLSRTLRLLGRISSAQPDWVEKTLAGLADSYLALRAFRKRDQLSEPLLADLQHWIGIPAKKEGVLQKGERVSDVWAVMGQTEAAIEDKLKVRRTWLLGTHSRRYALLMDYAFGGAPFAPGFVTGTVQQGTVAWYPSAWPLRALVFEDFQPLPTMESFSGFTDFQSFAQAYSAAVGQQPWLTYFPAAFLKVTVFLRHEKLFAVDGAGKRLPLQAAENTIWRLLAVGGGHPVDLFGEWDGAVFTPLTVQCSGRTVVLDD